MPQFGKSSKEKLETCHPDLQKIMNKAIEMYDFTVLEGRRTLERQKELVAKGMSKTLNSKHIPDPKDPNQYSRAIDISPYPVNWSNEPKNLARWYFLQGIVSAIAHDMGIKVRFGLDWDGDRDFTDQSFDDLPHLELVE